MSWLPPVMVPTIAVAPVDKSTVKSRGLVARLRDRLHPLRV